jgi:predicted NAD/FAD-dependent oxidoreductase
MRSSRSCVLTLLPCVSLPSNSHVDADYVGQAASLLSPEVIEKIALCKGREAGIKRWKFAQINDAIVTPSIERKAGREVIQVLEGGRVILAGDGTAGGQGGIEGAWLAGVASGKYVTKWLEGVGSTGEHL